MAPIGVVRIGQLRGARMLSVGANGQALRSFSLDGTLSENIEQSTTYPEHPTEDGYNITDTRITEPQRVSIEGIITRTPLWDDDATNDPLYFERTLEALEAIERNGEEVTVTTSLRAYAKRRISRLSIGFGQADGESVRVSFDLVQIRTVTAQTVDVPALAVAEDKKGDASAEANAGTQTGTPDPADTSGAGGSTDKSGAATLHDAAVEADWGFSGFLNPGGN